MALKIVGNKSVSASCFRPSGILNLRSGQTQQISLPLSTSALESLHASTALHKSLHHPSLVSLHSSFTAAHAYYLVLELCEGGTLWSFLESSAKDQQDGSGLNAPPRLTEPQLRPVLRSIVEGISHLYAQSIIYGELNLKKVILTADGRAVSFNSQVVYQLRVSDVA